MRTDICTGILAAIFGMLLLLEPETAGAQYRGEASFDGSARVAVFCVEAGDAAADPAGTVIDPGDPDSCVRITVPVINRSEVEAAYSSEVTGLPAGMSSVLENGQGILAANGGSAEIAVILSAEGGGSFPAPGEYGGIGVRICFEQTGGEEE